jgi:hypothetical protein
MDSTIKNGSGAHLEASQYIESFEGKWNPDKKFRE